MVGMDKERESVFSSVLRAFFGTLFRFIAVVVGLILLVVVVSVLSGSADTDLKLKTKVKILPDADGTFKKLSDTAPVILRLNIRGVIGSEFLNMDKVRTQLIESRLGDLKDDRVKGIFLQIESPGGAVIDSDVIYHALKEYKARYKVPVLAYVDGMSASGGYYIAAAADKIYASDVSIVGSVGVIMSTFFNVSQLLDKWGVQALTLSDGKGKDELNPFRPWSKDESENLKSLMDYYYQVFVNVVTSNRPIEKEALIDTYGAHIFAAPTAHTLGYIDGIENDRNVILKQLVKEAGLEGKEYQYIELEETTWLAELFDGSKSLFSGKIVHQVQLPPEVEMQMKHPVLFLYKPGM